MSIPRQLPIPPEPTETTLLDWAKTLGTRLGNWIQNVSDNAAQQVLFQVPLTPGPDGMIKNFQCRFKIARAQDGTPQTLIVGSDGRIVPWAATAGTSTWTLVDNANGSQDIVFGMAPGSGTLFCAFLVTTQTM